MNKYSGDAKLNPILQNLKDVREGTFKRPDHPDFMTGEELKKSSFSGIRDNTIGMQYEIWVVGEMVKSVSYVEIKSDPYALTKAQMEYFKCF